MKPVVKPHTNAMIGGRKAMPHETSVMGGLIDGLPATKIASGLVPLRVWFSFLRTQQ